MLLVIIVVITGCASITYKDLVPQPAVLPPGNQQPGGTVNVQSMIIPEYVEGGQALPSGRVKMPLRNFVSNDMLKEALEEAVAANNLFARVERGNADYVLDVWVEKAENHSPTMGFGEFTADFSSIWRLTRVGDGKVLVCDFVDGHGSIKSGMAPLRHSIIAGMRDMIWNGLLVLSDRSKEHLAAMPAAGIRKSMGPAVPEGLTGWAEDVKKNWSKIHMGMTMEEVESCIGPVKTSGALVKYYTKGYTQAYETGIYTLVFISGKLSRWELR
jgi:hypothetical protein